MKRLAAAGALILAGALWFVASSQGGGADERLPVGGDRVTKVSPKELRLGFARVMPWQWTILAEERPSMSSRDRVCFSVDLYGPLVPVPGHGVMGPGGSAARGCGPIDPSRGVLVAQSERGGSVEPPKGKIESWQSFDVGIAAYPPSVGKVRLVFSDGASEILKTRAVPKDVAFRNTESFRYAIFAVHGCVSEAEGFVKSRVVARVGPRACDDSE